MLVLAQSPDDTDVLWLRTSGTAAAALLQQKSDVINLRQEAQSRGVH